MRKNEVFRNFCEAIFNRKYSLQFLHLRKKIRKCERKCACFRNFCERNLRPSASLVDPCYCPRMPFRQLSLTGSHLSSPLIGFVMITSDIFPQWRISIKQNYIVIRRKISNKTTILSKFYQTFNNGHYICAQPFFRLRTLTICSPSLLSSGLLRSLKANRFVFSQSICSDSRCWSANASHTW